MNIGLFFGSFNPIHVGHCLIAMYAREEFSLDQVWFVVSPQNPLKEEDYHDCICDFNTLEPRERYRYSHKFTMVKNTCEQFEEYGKFVANDTEYMMSKPFYTSKTLKKIKTENPDYEFSVIMGSDCFNNIEKWKNYKYILKEFPVLVYERPSSPLLAMENPHVLPNGTKIPGMNVKYFGQNHLLDISSTHIRQRIAEEKSIQFMVPEPVRDYIIANSLYKIF